MLRPILIVGPLADCVIEKLLADFPDKFNRCIPEVRYFSQAVMEKGVMDNVFIDYRKKGNSFECTSISALKDSLHKVCTRWELQITKRKIILIAEYVLFYFFYFLIFDSIVIASWI